MGFFNRKKKNEEQPAEPVMQHSSLLEKLQGFEPIFTDHESDIQFQEEYEAQQRELAANKLREGLKKTREGIASKVQQLLNSFTKIDEDFFDELEETLILSDIGAETSMEICDKLRAEVKKTGTTEPADVKEMLFTPGIEEPSQRQKILERSGGCSVIRTGIAPTVTEPVLTLVTCTGKGYSTRWVVQAVRAEPSLG